MLLAVKNKLKKTRERNFLTFLNDDQPRLIRVVILVRTTGINGKFPLQGYNELLDNPHGMTITFIFPIPQLLIYVESNLVGWGDAQSVLIFYTHCSYITVSEVVILIKVILSFSKHGSRGWYVNLLFWLKKMAFYHSAFCGLSH